MNHASCKEWNNNDSVFYSIKNQFCNCNKHTSHNRNKVIEIRTTGCSTRAGPSTASESVAGLLQSSRNGTRTKYFFINQAWIMFTNSSYSLNKSWCTILQITTRKVSPSPIHNTCFSFYNQKEEKLNSKYNLP